MAIVCDLCKAIVSQVILTIDFRLVLSTQNTVSMFFCILVFIVPWLHLRSAGECYI